MATAKKKTAARKSSATASASLPPTQDIPEGFKQIGGGYAPTWKPVNPGDAIHGVVSEGIRIVPFKQGRKTVERRVIEMTTADDQRFAVWGSAALGEMFDQIAEEGVGGEYFVRYEGTGKAKPGQNPPKLFTVARAE